MNLRLTALACGVALAAVLGTAASDPPHWSGATNGPVAIDCTSQCHIAHASVGGTLTQSASNVNLCQSCHNATWLSAHMTDTKMAINSADKANPATGTGSSHAFDAAAANGTYGAAQPTNMAMQLRVYGGNIVCSTCHDQHAANGTGALAGTFGGTPRVSPAQKITVLGSTGVAASGGSYTGPSSAWYIVEIYSAGGARGTAMFHYSKDNGTSWFPATPGATLTAPTVLLDNGVTFSFGVGNYVLNERWQFYGGWPFLRAPMDSGTNASASRYCRDCHASWVMDHNGVNTYDGAYKSHPVGVPLNANGAGYDRVGAILDGNGSVQGSPGDGLAWNDLTLDAGNNVQCLTCHDVHHAMSNTSNNPNHP